MAEFLRRNPLVAALAGAALLLLVALALEWHFARPALDLGAARRASAADAKLLPAMAPVAPEQAYPETAARPLFTPTRRPAPEAAAQQQAAFQPGQFALLGVIMVGDNRVAMLREKSTGRIHRLSRGGEVNGIKLAGIERDSVTLAAGGQQERVPLLVQKAGAPGATPGGPGIPGGVAAQATLQGPFGGAAAPGGHAPTAPSPGFPVPNFNPGVPVPPGAQAAVPQHVQPPAPAGSPPTIAFPGATPAPAAAPDPNAGLSPEEILARRRARRAQTSQ